MLTICNVPLTAFKLEPTVEEMAAIIARMNSTDQAAFIALFSCALQEACGGTFGATNQIHYIAKSINESDHSEEWAGGLIKDLADAMGFDLVERSNPLIETIATEKVDA